MAKSIVAEEHFTHIKCSLYLVKEVLPPIFRGKTEGLNDLLKIMQKTVTEMNQISLTLN